jgi:hypothetical protein
MTVLELADIYLQHAQKQVGSDAPAGRLTRETSSLRGALAPLRRLYGRTPAANFGPLALKILRQEFIKLGWCRCYVNEQAARIVRMFRWACVRVCACACVCVCVCDANDATVTSDGGY